RLTVGAQGEDRMTRGAARLSRSSASPLWRASYARSTDRFSGLARFLGANPQTLEAVLAGQRSRADRDLRQDLVLGWVLNLMARYQLATESDEDDWLVIDEGFYQRGVALFSHGFVPLDLPLLNAYLDSIPQPEALVVVDTPLPVCEQRLERRGWSERVRHLPIEGRRSFLADAAAATKAITDRLQTSGQGLIWVDGTTPVEDSLQTVAATLRS
ncbi:MAG TPA: hypothetical protein VLS86_06300, partial [Acidimicrobiia bacterium]|nr:hypothetical protein [Acidimicrobiia bacterium]